MIMRVWKKSLVLLLPAVLAGYAGWFFIPCQPFCSVPVPANTKLLEFSPAGRFVITFQRDTSRLTLWRSDNGEEHYATPIPCNVPDNVSVSAARQFYGLSSADLWLAVVTSSPEHSELALVNLKSGKVSTMDSALPPSPDLAHPEFSSDGYYFCYNSPGGAVLYNIAEQRVQFRVPGTSIGLGPPTRDGKWYFDTGNSIECWDVVKRRRDTEFPSWPSERSMRSTSVSTDQNSVRCLSMAESPRFPTERIVFHRCNLATKKIETGWEYIFPPSARLFWNLASSDPEQFLLIKTLDDQGEVVQELLEIESGTVLARYPRPISQLEEVSFSYLGQTTNYGAGLIHTLGRTGEITIDSQLRVLASKQISRDTIWWKHFGAPMRWLGFRQGPPRLYLQFHSAQTGKLLERVPLETPYKAFDPVLAVSPSEPILAVVDEKPGGARLQFWQMPPHKPWGWIGLCAFAGGAAAALIALLVSKIRKKTAASTSSHVQMPS
jgi:hypothetical protein